MCNPYIRRQMKVQKPQALCDRRKSLTNEISKHSPISSQIHRSYRLLQKLLVEMPIKNRHCKMDGYAI